METETYTPTQNSSGPHRYTRETWVGKVSKGVTLEAAFEALRLYAAPLQERRGSQGLRFVPVPGLAEDAFKQGKSAPYVLM